MIFFKINYGQYLNNKIILILLKNTLRKYKSKILFNIDLSSIVVNNLLQVALTPLAQQLVKKTITTYSDNHLFITVIF